MAKQQLYVAVLVLQSRVGERDERPIVDHQVRLIRASTAKSAYEEAIRLGEAENATYQNEDGQAVTWEFLGLSDLDHLEEAQLNNGGEVFSWRTQGPGREFVREKALLAALAPRTPRKADGGVPRRR